MFDRDEPKHLMDSLCKFLPIFHRLKPDGISQEKLDQIDLPYALKRVYGCVGNWVGDGYIGNPFSCQDALVPFELLTCGIDGETKNISHRDNKTMFVYENQCVWTCAVDNENGADEFFLEKGHSEEPWTKMPFSLSHFLVTFMLLESSIGAKFRGQAANGKTIDEVLELAGYRSVPLWNGRYVSSQGAMEPTHFRCACDMKFLICGNEISTNDPILFDEIKDHLKVETKSKGEQIRPGSPSWDRISLEQQKYYFEYKTIQLQKTVDQYSADLAEMQWHMNEIQKKIDTRAPEKEE